MCGAAPYVQILVIEKTGATPGANWQEQLNGISWGSAATLEDAWEALKHLVEPGPTELDERARETEKVEAAISLPSFYFIRSSEPARDVEEIQLALDFG